MLIVSGYSIKEQLYEGEHYTVYRAERLADHKPVILKTCRFDQPPLADLAALQHEYKLLKTIASPGVIQAYDLIKHPHRLTLVLEDIEGISLHQYLNHQSLPLTDF